MFVFHKKSHKIIYSLLNILRDDYLTKVVKEIAFEPVLRHIESFNRA